MESMPEVDRPLGFSRSMFWSWRPVNVENTVTQARDFLASERNFFVGTRAAFSVVVAASALIFQPSLIWADWVLAGFLLTAAVLLPIVVLHNYVHSFDMLCAEEAEVHNTGWLIVLMIFVAITALLVAAREYLL